MGTVLRQGGAHVGRLIRAHPIAFAIAVFGSTMFVSAIAIAAVVIGNITDDVIIPVLDGGEPYADRLRPAVLLIAAIALYKAVGIIIRRVGASWLQIRSQMDFVSRLIHHQYKLSMPWHHGEDTGDLLAITDNDAGQATFVLGPLPYATGVSLLLIGALVLVTSIDVWLGLVALISFGLVVTADVGSAWFIFGGFEKLQRMVGDVSAVAHESFDGALTVKAIGAEDLEVERFSKVSNALRDQRTWVSVRAESFRTVSEIIPTLGLIAVIVVGGYRIQAGAITPGEVVTALYLMSLLSFPIRLIGFVTWETTFALASWRRIARIVEADDLIHHGEMDPSGQATGTEVSGENVTFSYPGGVPVLSDLGFHIEPGETVAIVGPTASGKSTMVSLLARLWDPDRGTIQLDGRDLRDFAERGVSSEVTIVPQEAFLFNLSVRENITLGQQFSEEQVRAAADLAQATQFVLELPHGFDTIVGEQGATLSGGQAQRIALARSIIRKPRLLILDDSTSAIDPSVETAILTGLRDAELPSTVVLVAYRQASITLADRIILVDNGKIIATGTHEHLLATQPVYSDILTAYADV